jgi:hypothetical protein
MSLVYYSNQQCIDAKTLRVRMRKCVAEKEQAIADFNLSMPGMVPTADLLGPLPGDTFYSLKNYDVKTLQPVSAPMPTAPFIDFSVPIDMNVEEVPAPPPKPIKDNRPVISTDDIIVSQGFVPNETTLPLPRAEIRPSAVRETGQPVQANGFTLPENAPVPQAMIPPSYSMVSLPGETEVEYVPMQGPLDFIDDVRNYYTPTISVPTSPKSPKKKPLNLTFDNENRRQDALESLKND